MPTRECVIPRPLPHLLSVVIPCFNEAENVELLFARLSPVLQSLGCPYEIIYVENGSWDETQKKMRSLAEQDAHVRVLVLTRNFGYQGAISAGFAAARGEVVVTMDGDLQDPPELIPKFLEKWRSGFYIIYGQREKREASWFYQLGYKLFYRFMRAMAYIDIPLDASDFALIDRRVLDVLLAMPERDRLIRAMRAFTGFKHAGVPYDRPARQTGASHFTLRDYFRFAQRGMFSFSFKPVEFISTIAGITVVVALLLAIGYFILALLRTDLPRGFPTTILIILFLGGIQLLSLAIIGEYVGRIFEEIKQRPLYVIEFEINRENKLDQASSTMSAGTLSLH
ncbi:MAG TPA: glycosyltransferase family 2 protein [Patescibacteria group bacterium]|nr:glycosyltransferase family 2 protein [Patescibacteria group bacterium]